MLSENVQQTLTLGKEKQCDDRNYQVRTIRAAKKPSMFGAGWGQKKLSLTNWWAVSGSCSAQLVSLKSGLVARKWCMTF